MGIMQDCGPVDYVEKARLDEQKRCYDIVFERFTVCGKVMKSFPDSKELGCAERMVEDMIIMERIDNDRFSKWIHSLPKE